MIYFVILLYFDSLNNHLFSLFCDNTKPKDFHPTVAVMYLYTRTLRHQCWVWAEVRRSTRMKTPLSK